MLFKSYIIDHSSPFNNNNLFQKSCSSFIFECEKNRAVLTFIFLVAKLQPRKFRMIYSMIEVDDGLNTCSAIIKTDVFLLLAANRQFLLEDLEKPCSNQWILIFFAEVKLKF